MMTFSDEFVLDTSSFITIGYCNPGALVHQSRVAIITIEIIMMNVDLYHE